MLGKRGQEASPGSHIQWLVAIFLAMVLFLAILYIIFSRVGGALK